MEENNNGLYQEEIYEYAEPEVLAETRMNVPGLIGMIIGIVGCSVSVLCCWHFAFLIFASICGITALVLGIVGVTRKGRRKDMARAGLILGIVSIVLPIVMMIFGAAILGMIGILDMITMKANY